MILAPLFFIASHGDRCLGMTQIPVPAAMSSAANIRKIFDNPSPSLEKLRTQKRYSSLRVKNIFTPKNESLLRFYFLC